MGDVEGVPVMEMPDNRENAKLTTSVVITCIIAGSSGLNYGYDLGISGGVTTMGIFLGKFFPSIKLGEAPKTDGRNMYCIFDSQALAAFTSSLYLAGLASSLFAAPLISSIGRRNIMVLGGSIVFAGGVINGFAVNIAMLILGRILIGFGVGFTNQAGPVYLSETAPPKWRGAFNSGFPFFLRIGVVVASCLNYGLAKLLYGWRLSLGLVIFPAVIMVLGGLIISDTPSSLVERGKITEAKKALIKARGTEANVTQELAALVKASEAAKAITQEPFVTILERQYRPHLTMAILIPFFQQLTGINVISFYASVLFRSVGFGSDSALIASIILGSVALGSISVSTFMVDRYGRRFLFKVGGLQMFICLVGLAILLATRGGVNGTRHIQKHYSIIILVLMCLYVAGFGISWGPLNWLIPSEIFPLKIRARGQSISVAVNFATTFVLSQTFLVMLCHFRYGVFFFYAGWIAIMSLFVTLFLPETKGIHIDEMNRVWMQHWYWRRFVDQ